MKTSLADKVAIVTGASSGIGEAAARALAGRGAKVVLTARRADRLERLARAITGSGGEAIAVPGDVTRRDAVQAVADRALEAYGAIDVLINNAGTMAISPLTSCRVDDWDRIIDVNVKGALYAIASVLPEMLRRGRGHIVNVGSVAGHRESPTAAVYCGSKFALHAISESLRMELAERSARDGSSFRVSIVAPGVVTTELRDSIADPATREAVQPYYDSIREELRSEDIADAIVTALEAPPHVSVCEILVRPTSQIR